MIDPLAAMQAACLSVANGDAAEVEIEFTQPFGNMDAEERLTITVRREVRHFGRLPGEGGGESAS
jgi:hypothetical protein